MLLHNTHNKCKDMGKIYWETKIQENFFLLAQNSRQHGGSGEGLISSCHLERPSRRAFQVAVLKIFRVDM